MITVRRINAAAPSFRRHGGWLCALAGFLLVAGAVGAGLKSSHAQSSPAQDTKAQQQEASAPPGAAGAVVPVAQNQNAPSVSIDPQKQEVASEAADLLKMATALKTEVDKSTKDTLSVTVVRKAGEIEQLAHKVRTGTGTGKG